MTHEDIVFYTKLGICPQCRKERLWGDEKACLNCRARQSIAQDKRYERKRTEILKNSKDKREQRKSEGLCTRCGKYPHKDGVLLCQECSDKVRKYKRYYYKKKKQLA